MPITYTNRKRQLYYLHAGKTASGKPRWFMSTKAAGELAQAIPEGHELYEDPESAQVFVRKIPPKLIDDAELELVRQLARTEAQTPYTIVIVKDKSIIVYAAEAIRANLGFMAMLGAPMDATRQFMEDNLRYVPLLRFTLADAKARQFAANRWCFLGSIDGWFPLSSGPLLELAARFIRHIGAESFFDLM
jgi:hypothetical protein